MAASMSVAHYECDTSVMTARVSGPSITGACSWKRTTRLGSACLCLVCALQSWRTVGLPTRPARQVEHWTGPCPGRHGVSVHKADWNLGGVASNFTTTLPMRRLPGGGPTPSEDGSTAPILDRARKLAGLWVVDDNGQDAYLAWMDFCQDWARHRLKQIYFETHHFCEDPPRERTNPCCTAQWAWRHGRAPPYRTTEELDRMANDICEEAWDQGRDIRGHLVALIRMLQQRGLLPKWFYSTVIG